MTSSSSSHFDIRRVGGRIGAEILGVDLATTLDSALVAELNTALLEHKALFFRDQQLDDADQIRFARLFGELTTAHPTVPSVEDQPNILPENTVHWTWAPGDLVLFDNRITQHYAPDDYDDLPRELHRVTVAGDVPVGVDGRLSRVVAGDEAAHYTPLAGAR